jgi:hypothetical protein
MRSGDKGPWFPSMFFCTGCQNVQAIKPSPAPVARTAVASTASPASPEPVPVCPEAGEPDAGLDLAEKVAISEEHAPLPPLPPSRSSTPDSDALNEAEASGSASASAEESADEEEDTRMPVNRVVSTFDYSNYGQQFTVHKIPYSKVTIRAYEGLPNKYVTIDTTEPLTVPVATLREVLNSIQPDPEKKRLSDSLMLMMAFLFTSIMLRTRNL